MEKKLKVKWVKALRSGKYMQARRTLETRDGAMCCLGVLATIQGCDLKEHKAKTGFNLKTATLPRGFNAGLSETMRNKLAGMNDKKSSSFAKIADYIAAKL